MKIECYMWGFFHHKISSKLQHSMCTCTLYIEMCCNYSKKSQIEIYSVYTKLINVCNELINELMKKIIDEVHIVWETWYLFIYLFFVSFKQIQIWPGIINKQTSLYLLNLIKTLKKLSNVTKCRWVYCVIVYS